jgi:hypothetical protein
VATGKEKPKAEIDAWDNGRYEEKAAGLRGLRPALQGLLR